MMAIAVDAASHQTLNNEWLWAEELQGEPCGRVPRANPFITAKGAAEKLGIAFTTAQRAIERLQRVGIVKKGGHAKRDRVFCARALLDILEEPARLNFAKGQP